MINLKRKIANIFFILLFLVGAGIFLYPVAANQWNQYRQNQLISNYEDVVDELSAEDYEKQWEDAEKFNNTITTNNIEADAFGIDETNIKETKYWSVLNVANDGIMGYITIPKIDVKVSICHGTAEKDLQEAAGHINGTSLPIGGAGTHSVIAAHRGLPSAKLFSDVDQLEPGDKFYIHVFDKVLAYKVDQILSMVEADDMETLKKALAIEPGKDYVSLFTCTPYGVNTHRLIVRGVRTEYNGEEDIKSTGVQSMVEAVQDYYMLFIFMGIAVIMLTILLLKFLFGRKKSED